MDLLNTYNLVKGKHFLGLHDLRPPYLHESPSHCNEQENTKVVD